MGLFTKYKISPLLSLEIAAFSTAGSSLNENCSVVDKEDVSSLPTACAFIDEQAEIQKLIELYIQLVQKDAADFLAMQQKVQLADRLQASRLK